MSIPKSSFMLIEYLKKNYNKLKIKYWDNHIETQKAETRRRATSDFQKRREKQYVDGSNASCIMIIYKYNQSLLHSLYMKTKRLCRNPLDDKDRNKYYIEKNNKIINPKNAEFNQALRDVFDEYAKKVELLAWGRKIAVKEINWEQDMWKIRIAKDWVSYTRTSPEVFVRTPWRAITDLDEHKPERILKSQVRSINSKI